MKLKEILNKVKKAIQINTPDYNTVIKGLHLYYDMKFITIGINEERNLIVQFPVFIWPYIQQQLILNKQAHSYTHFLVYRPSIVVNSETYISLRH